MERETHSVTLFVPCCGVEEGLAANLKALEQQDYPNLRLVFVVEHADDAAIPIIKGLLSGELVIAGAAEGRGQKVHNLLAAIDRVPPSDVWAFADSDGRPDPGWLRRLVSELDRPGVGVASTYRFYVPEPLSFLTLLRSVWNASVLSLLGNHDRNFAWGGGMAIPARRVRANRGRSGVARRAFGRLRAHPRGATGRLEGFLRARLPRAFLWPRRAPRASLMGHEANRHHARLLARAVSGRRVPSRTVLGLLFAGTLGRREGRTHFVAARPRARRLFRRLAGDRVRLGTKVLVGLCNIVSSSELHDAPSSRARLFVEAHHMERACL